MGPAGAETGPAALRSIPLASRFSLTPRYCAAIRLLGPEAPRGACPVPNDSPGRPTVQVEYEGLRSRQVASFGLWRKEDQYALRVQGMTFCHFR